MTYSVDEIAMPSTIGGPGGKLFEQYAAVCKHRRDPHALQ
jgi:hypothetical protein